ncbi:hypothetical protein SEA_EUGENEKRABS_18 [Microbacterium phage EugeneKrabs]|nr:hypothetical protein SEA_EUGENEKRABS_18 [Microbacterium phage EugeneKrabs]
MSHEISKTDKVLSVREPMWHGLEIRRDTAPTREEAEKLVHDWDVIREPLYRKVLHPDLTETYELLDTVELNVRSDTGTVLDAVNSDRVDVDPDEVWDVAETIMKQDPKIQIETAGSLREGRDIWILLKLDEIISIKGDYRGDSIAYFALQNSYVMGRGFRFQPTNVRIQCANTSSFADFNAEAAGLNLSLAHTQNLLERIEEIESKLQAWRTGIDEWKEAKEYLATLKVTTAQANWFVETYIDAPPSQLTSQRVKDNIELSRAELVFEYFNEYNDGVRGTALGLFEAASSWAGHVRKAQSQESRFKRAMLTPDTVLQDAARLAKEASLV